MELIFNVTLVNSFLLSDHKEVRRFRVDLQKALLGRSARIQPKRLLALGPISDPEIQHRELISGHLSGTAQFVQILQLKSGEDRC